MARKVKLNDSCRLKVKGSWWICESERKLQLRPGEWTARTFIQLVAEQQSKLAASHPFCGLDEPVELHRTSSHWFRG
ncbi:hypothetical protein MITS9509_02706 [Synechococcus sp. MIT S9509]|nr:hypothetical protein MITS9504_02059 [Synechococcus sp. MIT S9504]KZR90417.1 hypothetical protein MITS9509_02706 [Synechococcus sp. MIT S9509]